MNYHIEELVLEDALSRVSEYDYAVLYCLSGIRVCETGQLTDADWKECVEARVFRRERELHLFPLYDRKAFMVSDTEDSSDTVEATYSLTSQFCKSGKTKLIVKRYLGPDEAGQMHIIVTRLAGLE